jgi:hypothetical protein
MATRKVSSQLLRFVSTFSSNAHMPPRRSIIQFTLILVLIFTSFFISLNPDTASAGQVTLAWDMNSEPNVMGYKIYYGTASRNYDWFIDVGNVTSITITDLPNGSTYYFAATAYDNSNPPIESTHSDEVNKNMCTYSISPVNASFGASGGTGSVSVTTQAGCAWTASSGASWMTITAGSSGVGNGTIYYSVSANTNPNPQSASSTFAGKVFTVTQSAATTYTITASASTGGTITPSGTVTVAHGATQAFNITASAGYQILNVTVDGASIGAVSSYTFNNVNAGHTITATFSVRTYTITASAGTGGSISPSGSTSIYYGANQIFTITPSTGYSIADVAVDGVSQGAISSYAFNNVTANHTISATFKTNSFTIGSSASAGGTISPSGNVAVTYGASQTFTITPDSEYAILDVLIDGSSVGAVSSYTFQNVTSSHTINATFVMGYTLTITTSGTGSGHIIASPSATVYAPGTKITLQAIRDDSSYFDGFSGDCTSNRSRCSLILNKNGVINASFELRNFKVKTVAVGNGTVSMERFVSINNKKNVENVTRIAKVKRSSHLTTIDYGSQLVYHVDPEPGHYIKKFLVDGKQIKTIDTVTFANIKRNHRIRVRFASIPESTFQAHLKVVGKQIVLQDDEDRGHLQIRTNDPEESDDGNPIVQSSTNNYAYFRQ